MLDYLMRKLVSIKMSKPSKSKYWYPLSLPTYGEDEVMEALDSLTSFRTTMSEKTARFEDSFRAFQGCKEAIMVNSGSSADLLLSFMLVNPQAPRLRPGDEILVPAVTWPTQIWSPIMAGLKAKMVDVDPETMNISVEDLKRKITKTTRAIFVVHLLGNPCEMGVIPVIAKENNIALIEDCCESLGASWGGTKVGNFGLGASFSFFFSHHMTTMEGGMVTTNDPAMADHFRMLRAHGWARNLRTPVPEASGVDQRYLFHNWGFNLRPTELQAGFGLHQIAKLPEFNRRRNELAAVFFNYIMATKWLSRPKVPVMGSPAWFALPLMVSKDAPFSRADITAFYEENGIETRPIVAGNLALQPAAKLFPGLADDNLPGATAIHDRGFYLGLSPLTPKKDIERLALMTDDFLSRAAGRSASVLRS